MTNKKRLLTVQVLGGVDIRQDDAPVTGFATQKALALFVYLAVTRQAHTRDHLDTLLWSNLGAQPARRALRYALWNLRQILGPYLIVTPQNIAFDASAPHTCDAQLFLDAAQPAAETLSPAQVESCVRAAELYRGDFLQGVHVRDAEEFETWMQLTRERLHRAALDVLSRLVRHETAQQNYARGIAYAQRWLELEAWNEDAHRALIQLYLLRGDTNAARAQYETCKRVLAQELNTEPAAATRALMAQLDTLVPTLTQPRHNLPAPHSPFFGRQAELERILKKFRDPTCRLITLTGEGGIGKTRLALEAAGQLLDDFVDGVWLVSFSGVEAKPDDVVRVLARTTAHVFGLGNEPGADVTAQLAAYLRSRRLLLVLDNLEQFLQTPAHSSAPHAPAPADTNAPPVTEWVRDLLSNAPNLRLLVTSRALLNLQSEHVMRLDGLQVPPDDLAEANAFPSVQLFLERAERTGAHASELDLSEIARVCRFVEGMPLAIELAASWMNRAAPGELFDLLQNDPTGVTNGQADVPARHHSLQIVFEYSWELLSAAEQSVLAQASIFHHRFTRQAAREIIARQDTSRAQPKKSASVSQQLDSLLEKSLLQWSTRYQRFRMHPLIRQFAAEKLSSALQDGAARRHAHYFLKFAAAHTARLNGPDTHAAMQEIQNELTDIRAAWEWSTDNREIENLAAALQALTIYFDYAGLAQEGLALLERTAQVFQDNVAIPREFVLELALARAMLMVRVRQYEPAQKIAEQVLPQAAQCEHHALAAQSRYVYALTLARLPDTDAELENLYRARLEAQATQQTRLEALCLHRIAMVLMRAGEYQNSRVHFLQAQNLFETVNDLRFTGRSMGMVGLVEHTLGNFSNAVAAFSHSIEIADVIGDSYNKAVLLSNLGLTLAAQGQYENAIASAAQSREQYLSASSPLAIGAEAYCGIFFTLQGNWAKARSLLENIITVRDPAQKRYESIWAYWGLTLLSRRLGYAADAIRFGRLALGLAKHWDDKSDQADIGIALGDALFEQEALQEAREQYTTALQLREQMQQPHMYPEAMTGLAQIAFMSGDTASARMWINRIWSDSQLRLASGPFEPFWVYWNGYQVMRALGDPRASRLLETAQFVLAEYAAKITDPHARDQYLQVPWHRALLDATQPAPSLPTFIVSYGREQNR